jgi:hypothetical protein
MKKSREEQIHDRKPQRKALVFCNVFLFGLTREEESLHSRAGHSKKGIEKKIGEICAPSFFVRTSA